MLGFKHPPECVWVSKTDSGNLTVKDEQEVDGDGDGDGDGDDDLRSDLSRLEVSAYDCDPILLFKSWYEEAKLHGVINPNAFCLATASRDGKVAARHLLLRKLDSDNGFVIVTDKRSLKCKHLRENPDASMAFLWCYTGQNDVEVHRQVRVNGRVTELDKSHLLDIYNTQPAYCKVRAHLCHQGKLIHDWMDLKQKHDLLHNHVKQGKELHMPDHFIGYKLQPKMIEFYDTVDYQIADRVMFLIKVDGSWSYNRLAA